MKSALLLAAAIALSLPATSASGQEAGPEALRVVVAETATRLREDHGIPGIAIAVTAGNRRYFYNYGIASLTGREPVDEHTIFEVGSVSKAFTATLAAYAAATGKLALGDKAKAHIPELAGSAIGEASLRDLGTYNAGGLPLQFPETITTEAQTIAYFLAWQPAFEPGSRRRYSNPSIGLFGRAAAGSLDQPFDGAMARLVFAPLGLSETFIQVPPARRAAYAWGHTRHGVPTRVSAGPFASEAYGVKTTSSDMIRFVEAHIDPSTAKPELRAAILSTQQGFYRVGGMVQGLGWEMYRWPTERAAILAGNSEEVALKPNKVEELPATGENRQEVLVNKTGSTNGFGAYVAFVPSRRIGVVLLANKNYPISARVEAAHRILEALDRVAGSGRP